MKIAVLLTCYNRKNKTLRCLSDLFAQNLPSQASIEVFLVDDGSTDGTGEAVTAEYPLVHVTKGTGQLFWNRGMHKAWSLASSYDDFDAYLWINDDTFLLSDCISRLIESSISHNNKCIIVGACCWENDKFKLSYGGYNKNKRLQDAKIEHRCETMNGNIVFIPRYVYKKIGNLDYVFHHSGGDLDYGYRARKYDIEIFQVKGFCGECNRHEKVDKCFDSNIKLLQRIRLFNYNHRFEDTFIAQKRHFGSLRAIFKATTAIVHLFLPSLYNKAFGNKNI